VTYSYRAPERLEEDYEAGEKTPADVMADELADEDDEMWGYVTPHDLRRSWATLMSAEIDDPLLIMDFGGWERLDTFLEHYRGSYAPNVQRRELAKVDWLDVAGRPTSDRDPELTALEQRAAACT